MPVPTCPAGHRLLRSAEGEPLCCDGPCGRTMPASEVRWSCLECDYDICDACGTTAPPAAVTTVAVAAAPAAAASSASATSPGAEARQGGGAASNKRKRVCLPQRGAPTGIALAGNVAKGEAEALAGAAHALGCVKLTVKGDSLADAVSHVLLPPGAGPAAAAGGGGGGALPLRAVLGVARGLWVLDASWVYHSLEAGAWLPEEQYEVGRGGAREARLRREAGGGGALAGEAVCLWGETHLPKQTLASLVRASGGELVASHRIATVLVSDREPTAGEPSAPAAPAAPAGAAAVGGGGEAGAEGEGQGRAAAPPPPRRGMALGGPRRVTPKWIFDRIAGEPDGRRAAGRAAEAGAAAGEAAAEAEAGARGAEAARGGAARWEGRGAEAGVARAQVARPSDDNEGSETEEAEEQQAGAGPAREAAAGQDAAEDSDSEDEGEESGSEESPEY